MVEAVVFDIDNTLTNDVSWLRVTELLGASVAEHEDIFGRFSRHELPYEDAKRQLVVLWQGTGKANKAHWENMFADWPLADGAEELVQYSQDQGYHTALITGSLDLFAAAVAKRLNIKHYYANTELIWDQTGNLVDFHYIRDQAAQKLAHLNEFTKTVGVAIKDCVAIGDGDNDIDIFKATGKGIAIGQRSDALMNVAWNRAHSLRDIIAILAA